MGEVDAKGILHTTGGRQMPPLTITPSLFLDKTVVLYGPSKTGKTVIIKRIMEELQGHIEQALVIAPTEPSNRSYEGYIDPPFIHYRIYQADPENPKKDDAKGGLRFLESIWRRQEMMAAIYTRANNADTLAQLFGRLPRASRSEGLKHIEDINKKRQAVIARVQQAVGGSAQSEAAKIKEVNEKFKKMLVLIYKKFITEHYRALWDRPDLTDDERWSLQYISFNPRLLLVFDDCAAQLKSFFNKDIFRCLFYQNRHCFITVIISCQDDTDLPANLRKNAFISFFTEAVVCTSNFERTANRFPKTVKEFVSGSVGDIFRGFRKLAYIREDDRQVHFYYIEVPPPKPFRFGSGASHEFCDAVQCSGVSMDRANPYFKYFDTGAKT